MFENPPTIADGRLKLNDAPGLGLTLSPAAVKKYGEKAFSTRRQLPIPFRLTCKPAEIVRIFGLRAAITREKNLI